MLRKSNVFFFLLVTVNAGVSPLDKILTTRLTKNKWRTEAVSAQSFFEVMN